MALCPEDLSDAWAAYSGVFAPPSTLHYDRSPCLGLWAEPTGFGDVPFVVPAFNLGPPGSDLNVFGQGYQIGILMLL